MSLASEKGGINEAFRIAALIVNWLTFQAMRRNGTPISAGFLMKPAESAI